MRRGQYGILARFVLGWGPGLNPIFLQMSGDGNLRLLRMPNDKI